MQKNVFAFIVSVHISLVPALARFKRRYEVKTKGAPPFKMFLFIFREASEKKIFKKMKFSGRC